MKLGCGYSHGSIISEPQPSMAMVNLFTNRGASPATAGGGVMTHHRLNIHSRHIDTASLPKRRWLITAPYPLASSLPTALRRYRFGLHPPLAQRREAVAGAAFTGRPIVAGRRCSAHTSPAHCRQESYAFALPSDLRDPRDARYSVGTHDPSGASPRHIPGYCRQGS